MMMASVCFIIQNELFISACPFGDRFGVEAIRGGCAKNSKQLAFIYIP